MTYFLAKANEAEEAIERVRELALEAIKEQELTGGKVTVLPSAILKSLDGEQ